MPLRTLLYFSGSMPNPERQLPLIITPEDRRTATLDGLIAYYRANTESISTRLHRHGALLFRGFEVSADSGFASVIERIGTKFLRYAGGNSPRTRVAGNIYTSTEYPPDQFIPMHNELSYCRSWPRRVFFCCAAEPRKGGQTPLLDSRLLLRDLPRDLVIDFRSRKIRYNRNLHSGAGFGRSWQETFETADYGQAEELAALLGAHTQWNPDGSLSLSSVLPATTIHPVTREEVWFNQADQFHPSTIRTQGARGIEMYEALKDAYVGREDKLPQNVVFGDGSPIPDEYLDTIRRASSNNMLLFDWKRGDLLMVDNVLTAHGRMPFSGERQILVSMTAD